MNINEIQTQLQKLDSAAGEILNSLIGVNVSVDEKTISRLDQIAMSAAKIAYGNEHAESLSPRLKNLITWCDHLDDASWKENSKKHW